MKPNHLKLSATIAFLLAFAPAAFPHEGHNNAPGESGEAPTSGPIAITAEARKNLALVVEEAQLRTLDKTVLVFGQIEIIPNHSAAVSSRIAGRVIDVKVSDGESVKKAQVVVEVESLQLGDPPPRVQYAAPIDGVVIDRHAVQGDSVEPNKHLMEIVDFSEVYAEGRIFEGQIEARVELEETVQTFKQIYTIHVEEPFADLYINELLRLHDLNREQHALRARFARRVVERLHQAKLRQAGVRESNLLLAYCLYFWESFALGYAFEVEIYRDLTNSSIDFLAHDIRDQASRFSAYDLQVLNLKGDIKTSLYFLYTARSRGLAHDFYITRFYEGSQQRTLVVLLQPLAWEQINGDTIKTTLEAATQQFPAPVMVQIEDSTIVIMENNVWKESVLHRQQNE